MEHHFDIDHAENYGIEEAILINHFIFWLTKNRANNKTIKDIELEIDKKIQKVKRVFTYNSVSAMQEIFPYMNDKKIYRVIESFNVCYLFLQFINSFIVLINLLFIPMYQDIS